ncbi:MAG: MGDG synthase family glycosyltransferase [Clostridia bacterium]
MKVIFFTASAGEGHNSICKTLVHYLGENYPNVETKVVDIFKDSNKLRHNILNNYYVLCNMFPKLSNYSFQHQRNTDYSNKESAIVGFFVDHAIKVIDEIITKEQPDVVYCAHTFAAIAVAKLREQYGKLPKKRTKVFSVVSDFDVAPCTECLRFVDYIFVPSEALVDDVVARNFDKSQIVLASIPISETFYSKEDKQALRKQMGFDDKFTVLMMSGAKSFTNTYLIIKNIIKNKQPNDDFQLIVINGKNEKLYTQIEKLIEKTGADFIHNFGFVDKIEPYMEVSDAVFTKLGGITTTEAIAKNLPIIAPSRLPLQENNNRDFLVEKNVCVALKKDKDLLGTIRRLKRGLGRKMQRSIKKFNQTNDLRKICEKMVGGNT